MICSFACFQQQAVSPCGGRGGKVVCMAVIEGLLVARDVDNLAADHILLFGVS